MMTPEAYARLLDLWHELCRKPREKIPMDKLIPRTKAYEKWLEGRKKSCTNEVTGL